jgi:hypothetical protein
MTKFKYLFNYWAKYHQIKINLQTRPAQFIFHTFRLRNPPIADPITSFALVASEARRTLHLLHNAALLEPSIFWHYPYVSWEMALCLFTGCDRHSRGRLSVPTAT